MKLFSVTLILFVLLTLPSACSKTSETTAKSDVGESKAGTFAVTPTPFTGQKVIIKGEMPQIIIADDLKDSVDRQELPHIWLELEQANGEVLRTELDDKLKESLRAAGNALLRYQYVIHHSEDPNERFNASFNHLKTSANERDRISQLEISLPGGNRTLTEEEISNLFRKQSGLINDRYWELDDHFYPKSSFYRFKEYVNKKLSYDLF